MRRILGLAVAVIATAATCLVQNAAARAATPAETLAHRYAPVVRLVEQETPCGHGEPYVPTAVGVVLRNDEVALRGPWDSKNIVRVAPTAEDLSRGLPGYHLDFPGNALKPACDYERWSQRMTEETTPTTYARVVLDPAHPDEVALQYWFFYVFNDFNDKHEGDWEMIQLDFDAATAEQALTQKPALVGYSQHEGAEAAHWGDDKLTIVDGTHPVVYPAAGSHANYYGSALYLGRSAAQGVGCDDTVGPSNQIRPAVAFVPSSPAEYLRKYPWLGYDGRWGELHQGFYNGPTGPNTKEQWTSPLTWADHEWRDRSFTVPAGGAVGSTATDFFCKAVAFGSGLLTSAVGNPSPVLIAIAGFLALLIWLASRTRWEPNTPFRVRRRRRWGSIVTTSWRLYRTHPKLFLGMGLLFLPLGLVITGAQYLLFRVGGLAPLVDAVGESNAVVGSLAILLGTLVTIAGLSFVQAATAIAVTELDEGRPATAATAYRAAAAGLKPLLGALLVGAVVVAVLDLTTLGALFSAWLIVRWSLLAQVVALEGHRGWGALQRSARLVRGSWWRTASLTVLVTGIGLALGPFLGALLLLVSDASFDFVNLLASAVYAVALPFVAIATTYLYADLAVREQLESGQADRSEILPAEA